MVKITEYAAMRGCTPQNVYLHLKKDEFQGHWSKGSIDDEAIAMLDDLITPANGIVVVDKNHQERIAQMQDEINRLHNELESSLRVEADLTNQLRDQERAAMEQISQLRIANATMTLQIETHNAKKKHWWQR